MLGGRAPTLPFYATDAVGNLLTSNPKPNHGPPRTIADRLTILFTIRLRREKEI